MDIKIEDYLSQDEIKDIVIEVVKNQARLSIGSGTSSSQFMTNVARKIALEESQRLIPGFEDLIKDHFQEMLSKLTLADFFIQSYGWRSDGNKLFNKIMSENSGLIDKKIKEIFKTNE